MEKRSKATRIDAEIAGFIQAVDGYLDCERKMLPYIEMLKYPQIPYTPEHAAEHLAIRRQCRELFDSIPAFGMKLAVAMQSSGVDNREVLGIANVHGTVGGFGNLQNGAGQAEIAIKWPAVKVHLQQIVLATNGKPAGEKPRGMADRKTTTTIDRDLKWLAEFEAEPVEIAYFANQKKMTRSAMSKLLTRARGKRESSDAT